MKELSAEAQENVNKLIVLLQARLGSSSKSKSKDGYGNIVYTDADIFSNDTLFSFLELSLSEFNQTPYFSFFTFADTKLIYLITDLLVEGATLNALASRALIERGREFMITDGGMMMDPPKVSDLLETQYATLLNHHWDKLRTIKQYILDFVKQQ